MDVDHLPLVEQELASQVMFVPRSGAEWDYMWEQLGLHFVNDGQDKPTVCYNEECGEVWQYMGTVRQGDRLWHEFRHRCHPASGNREYLRLPASSRLAVLGGRVVEFL